jgi:hypothetical protein
MMHVSNGTFSVPAKALRLARHREAIGLHARQVSCLVVAAIREHRRVVLYLVLVGALPLLSSAGSLVTSAPTNLAVTGTSSTTITLSWTAPPGSINHYQIERSQHISGLFIGFANTTTTTFADNTVSSGNAYLYRVRAFDGSGLPSPPSNMALGTPFAFTDDPLVPGVTQIKAAHLYELRQTVNAVRRVAGLGDATWTDTTLSGVTIKAVHVSDLRDRLGEPLAVLSISAGSYTDPVLTPGVTMVRKAHIDELRLRSTRGSSSSSGPPVDLSAVGQWSPVVDWPAVAVHLHVLPDRRVMMWDTSANARVVDPDTGNSTLYANPTTNLFCSGHSFLPDGRLLVTGGHRSFIGDGVPDTNIFDYRTNVWTRGPDMNQGRWYPSTCALATGEMLTLAGFYCSANCNPTGTGSTVTINSLPQVWQTTGAWRDLTNAIRGDVSNYPWLILSPNGQVFYAGPERVSRFLDTSGTGSWLSQPQPETAYHVYRDYGSCVTYEPGKVLILGGGNIDDQNPNLNGRPAMTAEVIDLNLPSPAWRAVGSMAFRRRQTIATILADGKVLVTGGTSGAGFNNPCDTVLPAEIWNPTTENWSTMASMQIPRIYHLTAVLLPDARVVVAGSTGQPAIPGCSTNQPDQANAEIYSPPYLFNASGSPAARPAILSAPAVITYGQNFSVETPDAASITKVTLIRLSSVTHSFNQNQRFNPLAFTQAGGQLSVAAPANSNLCPPGDYMLFILNQSGVPSIARVLRIG